MVLDRRAGRSAMTAAVEYPPPIKPATGPGGGHPRRPPESSKAVKPAQVFVDLSGSRLRWARRAAWAIAGSFVGYLLLLAAGLVPAPPLRGLSLPGDNHGPRPVRSSPVFGPGEVQAPLSVLLTSIGAQPTAGSPGPGAAPSAPRLAPAASTVGPGYTDGGIPGGGAAAPQPPRGSTSSPAASGRAATPKRGHPVPTGRGASRSHRSSHPTPAAAYASSGHGR
jgi:hypothetical protein